MKQKSGGIKRLMEFTGKHRGLLTVSRILSGISSVFILGPFLCVYFAARDLVGVFAGTPLDTNSLVRWGLLALELELIGLVLYFSALLCSHVVAFHTEKNLKMAALKHLAKMPMGYFDANPSGKLRKIIDDNSFQTETFIAHQLPDLVGAQVTMVVSLALMLVFDWRVGIPLLLLFGVGFFLQGSLMGKDGMKFMQTYQDSLETMNHEAVEYIRGISVVKVFGQTVQSITKFNDSIKSYRKFALAYTMSCKKGMVAFNSVINSSFLVLVPTALIIGFVSSDLIGFMQSYLFYVIFSPACAVIVLHICGVFQIDHGGHSVRAAERCPIPQISVFIHLNQTGICKEYIRLDDARQIHLPVVTHNDYIRIVQMTTVLQSLHQLPNPKVNQIQTM